MGNSAEQLDKGCLRKYITKGQKKEAKKQQHRKKRREGKNVKNPNPQYNRYDGGWAV
jgi:hypothetical protein